MDQPVEYWVVAVPVDASPGVSLRLLAVKGIEADARAAAKGLPSDVVGRVAVLQRVVMFDRAMSVTTTEIDVAVAGTKE